MSKSKIVDGIEMAQDVYEAMKTVANFLATVSVKLKVPYAAEITSLGKIGIKVVDGIKDAVAKTETPVEDLAQADASAPAAPDEQEEDQLTAEEVAAEAEAKAAADAAAKKTAAKKGQK